jgi:hypothetical protein
MNEKSMSEFSFCWNRVELSYIILFLSKVEYLQTR